MPYINIHVAQKMTAEEKDAIKSGIGQLISILPTKSEKGLMIDISDGHTMYQAGQLKEKCAFVDVRLFGESPLDAKKAFTKEVFALFEKVLGIRSSEEENEMCMNFIELEHWASRGQLR